MTFNSLQFAVFLPTVLALYWAAPHRARLWLLLISSYVFYGWWDYRFLGLIAVSTAVDFVVGRAMAATDDDRRRRALLATSIGVNLGILGFFKYFDFFVESATEAFAGVGIDLDPLTLGIILPVGISFYTFQTLSYTFDVYRRDLEPTSDLLTFGVYVAFFPQLVAGPIERARRLLPQFETPRPRLTGADARAGLFLILLGLVKKVAIADALAVSVNRIFAGAEGASWVTLVVGALAFGLQIYGDFSGYSDIARGAARLLGIDLMVNFRQPYLSRNVTAFWRTWHISLSTWLRDYLYIPLGGNRGGRLFTYRNLMVTMLLGGLWHGAAWTFVIWGGLHGLALAAHRALGGGPDGSEDRPFHWRDLPMALVTVGFVSFAWIFFRAQGLSQAMDYVTGILTFQDGFFDAEAFALLVPIAAVALLIDLAQRNADDELVVLRWPAAARGLAYGAAVVALIVWSGGAPVPFIYFQF